MRQDDVAQAIFESAELRFGIGFEVAVVLRPGGGREWRGQNESEEEGGERLVHRLTGKNVRRR